MGLADEHELGPSLGRCAGAAGIASAALLGASLRWAHHWGLVAETLVGAWSAAVLLAILLSVVALNSTTAGKRFAKLGLWLGLLSLFALVVAGLAAAAGADPAGACGGG